MNPHNLRSPEQWQIISQRIDFADKTVIDLGCGYGDILFKCFEAGASECHGWELDQRVFEELLRRSPSANYNPGVLLFNDDIQDIDTKLTGRKFDVGICFSVLPYLKDPTRLLQWMYMHCDISLIECQYSGDGPGFNWIENDEHMKEWLYQIGWMEIKKLGKTEVKGRNKFRTIWMCQ